MRVFYALPIDEENKNKIAKIQEDLVSASSKGSFCSSDNFHITLCFVGEVDFATIEVLQQAMQEVTFKPFSLCFDRLSYFQTPRGYHMILKAKENKELIRLQKQLTASLRKKDIAFDQKKFVPHLTIGRNVVLKDDSFLETPISIEVSFNSFDLYLSEQIDRKRIYTCIDTRKAKE